MNLHRHFQPNEHAMIVDWLYCQIAGSNAEIETNDYGETRVWYTTGRYGRTSLTVTSIITEAASNHQINPAIRHSAWCPLNRSPDT